ncbi:TonB-dependent receptor [Dokdonia sinensis]|uniref:TonB-dependent receptor n=1 Tax=Dokdonia sinensis TaxID=2479847 RepID=A0A3M0GZY1_9FLAO|nr:outer membrane beta-barrel protein [Dokdonia sinensis]RMB62896.1 TonB-dependent receptor [Dokdonia sinensis]
MQSVRLLLLAGIFLFSAFAKAQSFSITGTLKDKETNQTLEAATVFLETVKDSTLVTYTITDQEGVFRLEGRSQEKRARVNVSFLGYKNYAKEVDLSQGAIKLGDISLEISAATLGEIVLKSRAPITVKKDTLEFNVSSFKTKKDATVEDLLKELPGVEVDENGKILVNGKEVSKILVNGKPFFSNDPTIATRNLTKEIIEKIQVVDTKSDDEAFTGEEGDDDSKTINLTISEEKNKGLFGRVAGGAGTDDRFEYAGIVNSFNNDRRISVLAGGNNINSPGFSFGEIQKMFTNISSMSVSSNGTFSLDGRSFGGGQGIVNSRNIGANYADDYSEDVDASLDYFYSGANSFDERIVERENILPDRRFFTNSISRSDTNADSHNVNGNINIKRDSTILVNIRPTFNRADRESRFARNEESLNETGDLINQSENSNLTRNTGNDFENNISITKKWGDKGAFIRARVQNELSRQESEDFVQSTTQIFGDNPETITRDQFTDGETDLTGFNVNLSYRAPLITKKLFLDLDLGYRNDLRKRRRSTFDFNESTQQYDQFNELLSTNFEGRNIRAFPEIGLSYRTDKLSLSASSGYVFRTLENTDNLRPELDIEQDFEAVEFTTNLNYRFSPKMSIYARAAKTNDPPDVQQLNPFIDVTDPLDIVQGNPNLSPANRYTGYVSFRNYDFQKGAGYGFYGNINVTEDDVVTRSVIGEDLVRRTTYENVDGNYSTYLSANYNKKIKLDSIRSLDLGARGYVNLSRSVNFNNDVQYASKRRTAGPAVNTTLDWKSVGNLRTEYRLNLTTNEFGIAAFEDQEFVSHDVSINTTFNMIDHLEWRNDVTYNYNPNIAAGFQRSAWFWNTTVAYSFYKDKFTATMKVYDLLDQNTNARRTASANFIQDIQSTVLEQYVMFSLSYKFNTLGQKGEVGDDNFRFF